MRNLNIAIKSNSLKLIHPVLSPFKKSNKIFIHGIYGAGNLGDEAILHGINKQLGTPNTDFNKIVISKKPDVVYKQHGIPSIHPMAFNLLNPIIDIKCPKGLLLLGGGGILKDFGNSKSVLKKFLKVSDTCIRKNYQTMLYSAGVENIKYSETKKIIRDLLNRFTILTVRDPQSKRRLKTMGVSKEIHVTGDPGSLLFENLEAKFEKGEGHKYVIVNLRHWFKKDFKSENIEVFNNFLKTIAEVIDIIIDVYNLNVLFLPFRLIPYDNDLEIIEKVHAKMKRKDRSFILKNIPKFSYLKKIYKNADLTIGMRLHSLIFSFSSITPLIGFNYSNKVDDFLKYVNLNEFCKEIKRFNKESLINTVESIFNNYGDLCNRMKKTRDKYFDSLQLNTKLFREIQDG